MSSEKVNKFVRNEMEKYFRSDKWITLYIDDDDNSAVSYVYENECVREIMSNALLLCYINLSVDCC